MSSKPRKSVIREAIQKLSPYKPPLEGRTSSGALLLDFNERTIPIPEKITQKLSQYVTNGPIHQYPEYGDLTSSLGSYVGVDADQLMLTNGSDQGIEIIFRATTDAGDEAIVPKPTFAMLSHTADVQGLVTHAPIFTDEYRYPIDEVLSLISEKTKIITICNPSSPHGTVLESADILQITEAAPHAAVLVDECYFEYSGKSVVSEIENSQNLFITRTFSKTWGLASLRVGYIISSKENIEELLKVRGPYDVNTPACVSLQAVLEDPSFMKEYTEEVMQESRPFFEGYLSEKQIPFVATSANFVLTFPKNPELVEKYLRENGVLIRPRSGPGVEGSLRFSLGTLQQMKQVTNLLDQCPHL